MGYIVKDVFNLIEVIIQESKKSVGETSVEVVVGHTVPFLRLVPTIDALYVSSDSIFNRFVFIPFCHH